MGRVVRLIIGLFFILLGISYFLYPNVREWQQAKESDQIITRFKKEYETEESKPQTKTENAKTNSKKTNSPSKKGRHFGMDTSRFTTLYQQMKEYNESLLKNGQDITDAWNDVQSSMDLSILGTNDDAIGYVEIPDANIKLPLYLGSNHLSQGACVVASTSMPIGGESTNSVIAGHNGWRGCNMFHGIEELEEGNMVYVTNPWGTLAYQVSSMKVIDPLNVDEVKIQEGRDMVTLVTCYPYRLGGGENRLLIYCDRVNDTNNLDLPEQIKKNPVLQDVADDAKEAFTDENGDFSIAHAKAYYSDLGKLETMLRVVCPVFVVLLGLILLIKRK